MVFCSINSCDRGTPIVVRGEQRDTFWEGDMAIYIFIALVAVGVAALVVFRIKALRKDQRSSQD
jgi:hypothetical protein